MTRDVVVDADADASDERDLLSAQALDPAVAAVGGQSSLVRGDPSGRTINGQTLTRVQLQNFINSSKCLDAMSNAKGSKIPSYLLEYGSTAYGGDGKAAVCLGNPDTADNTAVCVPGLGQTVSS